MANPHQKQSPQPEKQRNEQDEYILLKQRFYDLVKERIEQKFDEFWDSKDQSYIDDIRKEFNKQLNLKSPSSLSGIRHRKKNSKRKYEKANKKALNDFWVNFYSNLLKHYPTSQSIEGLKPEDLSFVDSKKLTRTQYGKIYAAMLEHSSNTQNTRTTQEKRILEILGKHYEKNADTILEQELSWVDIADVEDYFYDDSKYAAKLKRKSCSRSSAVCALAGIESVEELESLLGTDRLDSFIETAAASEIYDVMSYVYNDLDVDQKAEQTAQEHFNNYARDKVCVEVVDDILRHFQPTEYLVDKHREIQRNQIIMTRSEELRIIRESGFDLSTNLHLNTDITDRGIDSNPTRLTGKKSRANVLRSTHQVPGYLDSARILTCSP